VPLLPCTAILRRMEGFDVVIPIEVMFRDVDAMGHTNNSVYLTWLENGRFAYWRAMQGQDADYADVPFVLARAEIAFRAPTHAGEKLSLGIRLGRVGRRSFDFVYRIVRGAGRQVVAEATTVQVMYDYEAGASMAMSEAFRKRLLSVDGRAR